MADWEGNILVSGGCNGLTRVKGPFFFRASTKYDAYKELGVQMLIDDHNSGTDYHTLAQRLASGTLKNFPSGYGGYLPRVRPAAV
jgi:hypothetical protein